MIHYAGLLGRIHIFFSSKKDGNMSLEYTANEREQKIIKKNIKNFLQQINLPENNIIFMKPNFGQRIEIITHKDPRLISKDPVLADGLLTYTPYLALACCYGDCLPIIIYAEKYGNIVSLLHAGRANLTKIIQKAISLLTLEFKIKNKNLVIVIGPAIKKESYILPEF